MDGTEIVINAQWIRIDGLTLNPILIPRESFMPLARAIKQALKSWKQEEKVRRRHTRRNETRAAREARLQKAADERTVNFSRAVQELARSMTPEQKRLAVAAHKQHVRACRSIGEEPASVIQFLREYRQPEAVICVPWTPAHIHDDLYFGTYGQYQSAKKKEAA